jgi:hypothetical protein
MTAVTIRDLMVDADLFGGQFGGESWAAWRSLLAGFYGLHLEKQERATFFSLTGLSEAPSEPLDELWQAIGRRGGKSKSLHYWRCTRPRSVTTLTAFHPVKSPPSWYSPKTASKRARL